jgi:hypothetical protein
VRNSIKYDAVHASAAFCTDKASGIFPFNTCLFFSLYSFFVLN